MTGIIKSFPVEYKLQATGNINIVYENRVTKKIQLKFGQIETDLRTIILSLRIAFLR